MELIAAAVIVGFGIWALAVRAARRKRIAGRLEQVRGWEMSPEEMANWAELMRGVEEAHAERAEVATKERKVA